MIAGEADRGTGSQEMGESAIQPSSSTATCLPRLPEISCEEGIPPPPPLPQDTSSLSPQLERCEMPSPPKKRSRNDPLVEAILQEGERDEARFRLIRLSLVEMYFCDLLCIMFMPGEYQWNRITNTFFIFSSLIFIQTFFKNKCFKCFLTKQIHLRFGKR